MATAALLFVSLFSLFYLFLFTTSLSSPTIITLPLYPSTNYPSSDPLLIFHHLSSLSLSRARHLKSPTTHSSSLEDIPLYSRSYGGYSISLSFGTPPQPLKFVMDTGSSLVWFPCTSRYLCSRCNFPNVDLKKIPTFIPKQSSSTKLVGCRNPKCSWIYGPTILSKCNDCGLSSRNCTQTCPPYFVEYALGSTLGFLLSETLDLPELKVSDFLVGCSIFSSRQPEGIAGFGRSVESIPSQLGLRRFAYCLVSRRYDDTPVSSDLILFTGSGKGDTKTEGLHYTPFSKNPNASSAIFQSHYYVPLRKINVGDKHVKIPYSLLVTKPDGNGGTIVDSGTTFTFMERAVFEPVSGEFVKQMANFALATDIQNLTGLSPCFKISGNETVGFPDLVFQFKGGANMKLPLENYIAFVARDVVCLTIVTDNNAIGPGRVHGGPAIILGSFQQQNYYIEYDLEDDRFGFKRHQCA
ncbi:hypothetical protein K2173_024083 [Erythroxylum novogranatense]|uniref:Peptidase A1 domain-containing protein n=1 Tax=Erythroxylum novogranatense TaxID=1862640 RepID=A0AAV8UF95_9ROSI|nr:hypothetical protein K2173_024083 [Erythroxylum novogranatense]